MELTHIKEMKMKKLILTIVAGLIIGQIICLLTLLAPNAIWDIESHLVMLIVGPFITILTVYRDELGLKTK